MGIIRVIVDSSGYGCVVGEGMWDEVFIFK